MSDLQHRASKITGLIMSNRLSDRFKQSDESIMQMMARIQSEITDEAIANQWENKLEEFGVIFKFWRNEACIPSLLLGNENSKGRTLPLSPMGAFQ